MSRSEPTANNPHPCTRWFEFSGASGEVKYYDKEKKENIIVPIPLTFIWLDETATIRGWHDASDSGILSNEVRDTRSDVMVVKAFKAGELCHGIYGQIRDRVASLGGHFSTNLYLGYKESAVSPLRLGCLQIKGAALNAWVEFKKVNGKALGSGAVTITGTKDGKKGSVSFKTPVFGTKEIRPETNEEAVELDRALQIYLKSYFTRTKSEQVSVAPAPVVPIQEPNGGHLEHVPEAQPASPVCEGDDGGDIPF